MNEAQGRLLKQIQELTRQFFEAADAPPFVPGETPVKLMLPTYDHREVNEAMESLFSTMITLNQSEGNKVGRFEQQWADFCGVEHGVMVNSGSSANLLALFVLSNPATPRRIEPGDEVITPAVTWHTAVSPILSVGAVPVLVDVTLDDYTIDVDAIEAHITPRTKAIMPVHLLGNPCDMDAIGDIARRHDLYVLEDTCEAHGSEWGGRRCGGIGDVGTFSFFFSHHLTTMEGGILVTNDGDFADVARIMRSQGCIRNTVRRAELEAEYAGSADYADLDPTFIFANLGFNLRPTELNGGFGLEQMKKFPGYLEKRKANGAYWTERMARHGHVFHLAKDDLDGRAWFCFPVIVRRDAPFTRDELARFLGECRIETRPVMAGNVTAHPAMKEHFPFRAGPLPNADLIHTQGLFWGNHPAIRHEEREYVADCIDRFVAERV